MILREIRFSNFLVFYGTQTLVLPYDKSRNVTLILANNNTGKTSVIRALKFLFYGSRSLVTRSTQNRPSTVICERAVNETVIGENVEGWVEVTFEIAEKTYRFRRTVIATKTRDGLDRGEEKLAEYLTDEASDRPHYDDDRGTLAARLMEWIPRGLFDAFYFQGEPLDGRMLEGVASIGTVLSGFLHMDRWKEAADALEKVQKEYERQLGTVASANQLYKQKLDVLQTCESTLEERKRDVARLTIELQDLEAQEAAIAEELKRFGDTAEHDELLNRRENYRNRQHALNRTIDSLYLRLANAIQSSQGTPFLVAAVEPARSVLEVMENENILPADISEGFVERVLRSSTCVCGQKHTDASREKWKSFLESALSAKLSNDLMAVLDRVARNSTRGPVAASQTFSKEFLTIRAQIAEARREMTDVTRSITSIDETIAQSPQSAHRELIRSSIAKMQEISGKLRRAQGEKSSNEAKIKNIELQVRRFRQEARAAEPKGRARAEIASVQRAIEITRDLCAFIDSYRTELRARLHQQLESLVSKNYNPHAVDRSRARVDATTMLPYIENVDGERQSLVGGGQQTLLSLAYVSALAELRKGIHQTMRQLNLYLGRADDQSFIVDSPFSATDPNYIRAIASFLTTGARQVVILMARQQWTNAREHLLPAADKIYAMRLHSKLSELKNLHPEDFDFQVNRKTLRLIENVDDVCDRHTEILEVN